MDFKGTRPTACKATSSECRFWTARLSTKATPRWLYTTTAHGTPTQVHLGSCRTSATIQSIFYVGPTNHCYPCVRIPHQSTYGASIASTSNKQCFLRGSAFPRTHGPCVGCRQHDTCPAVTFLRSSGRRASTGQCYGTAPQCHSSASSVTVRHRFWCYATPFYHPITSYSLATLYSNKLTFPLPFTVNYNSSDAAATTGRASLGTCGV